MATKPKEKPADDTFDFPPGWIPEAGERLIGAVTDRGIGEGEFGKYIVLTLKPDAGQDIHVRIGGRDSEPTAYTTDGTDDDTVAVHCFGAVLDNAVRRIRPKIGDRIGFRKGGKQLRKNGNPDVARDWFNSWQVRDLTVKSEDELYGPGEGSGQFDDDPPF